MTEEIDFFCQLLMFVIVHFNIGTLTPHRLAL
jgi:hypothetical protein